METGRRKKKMAERQGFEPWVGCYPYNRLAGGCLRPLGHLSTSLLSYQQEHALVKHQARCKEENCFGYR